MRKKIAYAFEMIFVFIISVALANAAASDDQAEKAPLFVPNVAYNAIVSTHPYEEEARVETIVHPYIYPYAPLLFYDETMREYADSLMQHHVLHEPSNALESILRSEQQPSPAIQRGEPQWHSSANGIRKRNADYDWWMQPRRQPGEAAAEIRRGTDDRVNHETDYEEARSASGDILPFGPYATWQPYEPSNHPNIQRKYTKRDAKRYPAGMLYPMVIPRPVVPSAAAASARDNHQSTVARSPVFRDAAVKQNYV